jgi:hypothetical protein
MTHARLDRIRRLSSRFYELQGLRVAAAGATIVLVFATYLSLTHPTDTGGVIALGLAFVLMIPGQWWAHRYYSRTFGRQVRTRRNPAQIVAFFTIYFAIATYVDRRFPEIPAGGPTLGIVVLMSLVVAIRDWPWRVHYLGMAAAVAGAFALNVVGVDVIDRGMTLSTTVLVTGLSMIGVGLIDHLMLVRLMNDARQPDTADAPAPH